MSSPVLQKVIHPTPPSERESPSGDALSQADLSDMLNVVVESAPVAIALFDAEMRYLMANQQWVKEFNLEPALPLKGRSQYEVFPRLHPGWRQVYDRALKGYVVRSDHDVLASSSGKPILFRWEVRPWRVKSDASVGGVIVTCDKFAPPDDLDLVQEVGMPEEAPDAPSEEETEALDLSGTRVPVLRLDFHGKVLKANDRALELALARGVQEGRSHLWEFLAEEAEAAALQHQVTQSIAKWHQTGAPQVLLLKQSGMELPSRWLLAGEKEEKALTVVGLEGLSPFDTAAKVGIRLAAPASNGHASAVAAPVNGHAEAERSREENARLKAELQQAREALDETRNDLRTLKEVEKTLLVQEKRQKALLAAVPHGLLVVDDRGTPVFQNEPLAKLFGQRLERTDLVEDWLGRACTSEAMRSEVQRIWREDVWRRHLTRQATLVTQDGLLKEIEFQPVPLEDGRLLVQTRDVTAQTRLDEQLSGLEGKFRAVLQASPVAAVLTDRAGAIYEVNEAAATLFGRPKAELRRLPVESLFDEASASDRRSVLMEWRDEGAGRRQLKVGLSAGEAGPLTLTMAPVYGAAGELQGSIHFLVPIESVPIESVPIESVPIESTPKTTRAPAETSLEVTATVPSVQASGPLLTAAANGRILSWSDEAVSRFGGSEEERLGKPLHLLFQPSNASGFYRDVRQAVKSPDAVRWCYFDRNGTTGELELTVTRGDNGNITLTSVTAPASEAPIAADQEVLSEDARPEESGTTVELQPRPEWALPDWNREQALLSETHHRIHSHLQILSSLLNLQANGVADGDAREALQSSQNRLRALASLHQHLEKASSRNEVALAPFVATLVRQLEEGFGMEEGQVTLHVDIPEDTSLPKEWLMPLTLTLHEALSNSLQHGFPDGRRGTVSVELRADDSRGTLILRDDGVGFDAPAQTSAPNGLGLKIMAVFADQMRAKLKVRSDSEVGTSMEMQFSIAFI